MIGRAPNVRPQRSSAAPDFAETVPDDPERKVPRTVTWVDGRAATFSAVHATPTDSFLSATFGAARADSVAADAACGSGVLTFMLASRVKKVYAADRDEERLRAAARQARERGARNVAFYATDLDAESWREWTPKGGVDLVTMHLFASRAAFALAADVMRPGASLVVAALGEDNWRETGLPSRFAYAPDALRADLEAAGLQVESLVNDMVFVNAPAFDVLEQVYFEDGRHPIVRKWKEDGRWDALAASFRAGSRGITESRLVARAVKVP